MEKYSAYRDSGTGIQPFLNPVPPSTSGDVTAAVLLPFGYIIGSIRFAVSIIFALFYFLLVEVVCFVLKPVRPLHKLVTRLITAVLARIALYVLGFFWISVTASTRKRGRSAKDSLAETWKPSAGDLIVSNWVSWVEVLWLAFRFNPVFVLPISEVLPGATSNGASPATVRTSKKTGRETGTGSANISTPITSSSASHERSRILGFRQVSLLTLISHTGHIPPFNFDTKEVNRVKSLEDIRKNSNRPVVVFPECTTSNGRALLKFADIFSPNVKSVPVRGYQIFLMCVRYDAPTSLSPTLTLSIPPASSSSLLPNPLRHLFSISTSLAPSRPITIRLLPPSESPSSPSFVVSEIASSNSGVESELLREACEVLIAGLGKLKRTQLGWEDKAGLLEIYYGNHTKRR